MAVTRIIRFKRYTALALLLSTAAASPMPGPGDMPGLRKRADINPVLTTTTPSGQVIDWIPIGSQGNIVTPPINLPPNVNVPFIGKGAQSELSLPGVQLGPPGTVPIPRMSESYLASPPRKQAPPLQSSGSKNSLGRRDGYSNTHWYVTSDQVVNNTGTQASYSLFAPYTAGQPPTCDFSLIQTACGQSQAALPGSPGQTAGQTVEAGWIVLPCQVSRPHLFTYYNINGYRTQGDYAGGWNTDYKGWMQLSQTYYPGVVLTPLSQINGTQNEMQLTWQLFQGNWFLYITGPNIQGQYMGYYPGTLFSNNTPSGSLTLANYSDIAFFYGEIQQFETNITTTDMGSGVFGSAGYGQSAYFHNMLYLPNYSTGAPYTAGFGDSNSSLWNHGNSAPGSSSWANYIYLGGPGAGGVTGA